MSSARAVEELRLDLITPERDLRERDVESLDFLVRRVRDQHGHFAIGWRAMDAKVMVVVIIEVVIVVAMV